MVYAIDLKNNPGAFAPAKFGTITILTNVIIPNLILAAALIFLVMLLYAAFTWLTAGDNPENIKKAQKLITFAVIGLGIVISSFLIVKLIALVLNVQNDIRL